MSNNQHPLKHHKRKGISNMVANTKKSKMLCNETKQVLDLVKAGKHVEMIGQAGTGKTFTLKRLMAMLDNMYIPYVATASTGRAALNIGGQTIHSFSGAGIGDQDEEVYLKKITNSSWYRKAWRRPKVLIIEEISMLGMDYFDLLDKIARTVRKKNVPFGGLQVVVCGDFLQLPPVNAKYVFHSKAYQSMFSDPTSKVVFRNIKRQSCPKLIQILKEARTGHLTETSIRLLRQCVDKEAPSTLPITPMILFARRVDVRAYNMTELDKLDGQVHTFAYSWQPSPSVSEKENDIILSTLQRNIQAPMQLHLKVNAQVMLVRNMPDRMPPKVNGSMGIVVKFCSKTHAPVVKFSDGSLMLVPRCEWKGPKGKGTYIQYPLILGWALTMHKAQGATVDYARMDLGNRVSQPNQAYTALSRVRTYDGLFLDDFDPNAFQAHAEALSYHISIKEC